MSDVPSPKVSGGQPAATPGAPAATPPQPAAEASPRRPSFPIFWILLVLVLVVGGVWYLRHRGQVSAAAASKGGSGAAPTTVTTTNAVSDYRHYVSSSNAPLNWFH